MALTCDCVMNWLTMRPPSLSRVSTICEKGASEGRRASEGEGEGVVEPITMESCEGRKQELELEGDDNKVCERLPVVSGIWQWSMSGSGCQHA